jgi:hypothetical protein
MSKNVCLIDFFFFLITRSDVIFAVTVARIGWSEFVATMHGDH